MLRIDPIGGDEVGVDSFKMVCGGSSNEEWASCQGTHCIRSPNI